MRLTESALRANEIVHRLRQAGAALEQQAALHPASPMTPFGLWLRVSIVEGLLLLILAVVLLRQCRVAGGTSGLAQVLGEPAALSPLELRAKRDRSGTTIENLSDNIRGYYRRIPGGFKAARRSAEQASREHPLECFPELAYHLLDRDTEVTIAPLPKNDTGETPSRVLGQYRHEMRRAFIVDNLTPQVTQEVREHELTHAWQFQPCAESEPGRIHAWQGRFGWPLGHGPDQEPVTASVLSFDIRFPIQRFSYLRDYLCRPVEIDPRLAALKRWWAWNHGELLDAAGKTREAFEHPRSGKLQSWPDVSGAFQIWDSYRGQPEVQQMLVWRVMQLL